MTSYLILGGHGFLGSKLNKELEKNQMLTYFYNRDSNTITNTNNGITISFDEYLSNNNLFNVVNLLAAWGDGTNDRIIKYANFDLPSFIFNKIASTGKKLFWVQINSYFYFHFAKTGIDKDKYSFWKRSLSDLLKNYLKTDNGNVSILEVYLPHLYGENDKSNRLIKVLTTQNRENIGVKLSSGLQILPILNVLDFARGLFELILKNHSQLKYTQIYIKEQKQLTVKEVVKIIQGYKEVSVEYNVLPERKYEFYSPITTKINHYNIDKLITFEQYLTSIYKKGIND
jgi:nucleoside-diphosphate-sugar epimerase